MVNIYVLNKDGIPLMPIHSNGRAKRLIKTKRAKIVNRLPFTIQLTEQIENPIVDECILGIDPGRTNIGLCVIDMYGHVLFASDVVTRNKAIAKLLLERKRARQASRRGERKARQRLASKTSGLARATEFWRMLPGNSKAICCHVIRNQEAKYLHRKRKKGWLTPTAKHLLQTHINAVNKVLKFLPVSIIAIEMNRFVFAKMENPGIRNWEYQKGKLAGYSSVEEALFIQQKGKCLMCNKKIDSYHHIVPVTKGGSESIDNRAGLCFEHHHGKNGVHNNIIAKEKLKKLKEGFQKKYHALSTINQIMPYLLEELLKIRSVSVTTGYETQAIRQTSGLPEKQKDDGTHYMDAWCIAVSALKCDVKDSPEFKESFYTIKQFRKHDRAIIQAQRERTYYLNGKAVAHNRHKRTGQADTKENWDSLAEFRANHPKDVAHLTVKKSVRYYNNTKRYLPGTKYLYEGKEYVLCSQKSNGTMWKGYGQDKYVSTKKCKVIKNNEGLVFIP